MDAISLQEAALTLLKNLESSSRSAKDRGREPANHSETTAFGPSPSKFKPRKFAKTDVDERSLSHHHSQYREKGARWGNFKNANFWSLVAKLAYRKIGVSTVPGR
ncbi:hypothetical protein E2C01_059217 [Portunus trituberculatus]|uniref:Uncharacterized protein n=1 Tax=Portunus trituberculatus TaxID=210409 RepID=A0A5B7GXG1_PORTR|nr:hypothetical protein [Portunus trituberculatus]